MTATVDLVKQLGDREQVIAFWAFEQLLRQARRAGAPGRDPERAALAEELARELAATVPGGADARGNPLPAKPKHPAAARNKLLRVLSCVAADKELPALEQALSNLETREMARYAVACNASAAAARVLVAALDEVGPVFRAGVVDALAARDGEDVLSALRKAASDPETEVRMAAVAALARFPDPDLDGVIAAAAAAGSPRERYRAQVARVRLAETLRRAGKKSAAGRIYRAIQAGDADAPQKKAAELGIRSLG